MRKYLLFLVVFLISDNGWSKPVLEIVSYHEPSGMPASAAHVDDLYTNYIDNFKKTLKDLHPKYTNIETRFYVDEKGFVVVGNNESIPAGIGKNDLFVSGNLFVDGNIYNIPRSKFFSDELRTEISTLKDEVTILKSEIAELKAEIRALRK